VKGVYKTKCGMTAIVGQIKDFTFRGAVKIGSVYYLNSWTMEGLSLGDPDLDLDEKI
jgi:hypothetical protein